MKKLLALVLLTVLLVPTVHTQSKVIGGGGSGTTVDMTTISAATYCADAGANDTYACNLSPAPTAYATGDRMCFKANTANTGASSINFNTLGALAIKRQANSLTLDTLTGDILAGQIVCGTYNGTNFVTVSQLAGALVAPDGSVGAPAFTFSGDSDTGIFRDSADSLSVSAGFGTRFTFRTADIVSTNPLSYGTAAGRSTSFGNVKTLTEGAAGTILTLSLTTLVPASGQLIVNVVASDASDYQIREFVFRFNAGNKAGTETCKVIGTAGVLADSLDETTSGSTLVESAGASTLTFTLDTDESGSNSCAFTINATSSLTQTTLSAYWHIIRLNNATITAG